MRRWIAGTLLIFLMAAVNAQTAEKKPLQYGAHQFGKRTDTAMGKWRANRFGQFIHWGLYAIPGGIWQGKTYPGAAEFLKSSAHVPTATWDSLMYSFNPVKFDAREWARVAKQMGVKYMTITTKHHEGFCLWPTKYTSFNISNTPFKRDVLKELIAAYNAEGIDVNFYYSVLDWNNPDWRYDIRSAEDSIAFRRYLTFAYDQLKELATNYPQVKAFWFDGTWDASVKKNGWWTWEVEKMLKSVIPDVIVNSRLRADDYGARHKDSNGDLMGDYESGYERRLPDPVKDTMVTQRDWEACMTIPENQWGYHKDWSLSYIKTPMQLLEDLVQAVSLGGNFLLNFGPKGDGSIRQEELNIASRLGAWLKENGEAVYHCDYAGWKKQDWGYYTKNTATGALYAVIFNQPIDGLLKINTPDGVILKGCYKPGHRNEQLVIEEMTRGQFIIHVPPAPAEPYVLVLETATGKSLRAYKAAKT